MFSFIGIVLVCIDRQVNAGVFVFGWVSNRHLTAGVVAGVIAGRTGFEGGTGCILPLMRRYLSCFSAIIAGRVASIIVCMLTFVTASSESYDHQDRE